jgi:ATP-binding cassette subfamily B protein
VIYQIKQSLTGPGQDAHADGKEREIAGCSWCIAAGDLRMPTVMVRGREFCRRPPTTPILHHVSFEIPPGKNRIGGVVRAASLTPGALALPIYDVQQGRITIGGQDIKQVTQPACGRRSASCRITYRF